MTTTPGEFVRPIWKWRWLRLLNAVARLKGRRISSRRRRGERPELALGFLIGIALMVVFLIGWATGFGKAEVKYDPLKGPGRTKQVSF